jgi:hypothetical protein
MQFSALMLIAAALIAVQWQTVAEARAKDRWERSACGR